MKKKKILICGLPGAGKTTIAKLLAPKLEAVWFNADEVRANINKDLGFDLSDRIEQAKRMGWLCDCVSQAGHWAVADFVCPTEITRQAFDAGFTIWIDRISISRFEDTNKLFEPPTKFDIRVTEKGNPSEWTDRIIEKISAQFEIF